MKRIILAMLLLLSTATQLVALECTTTKYWYYPEQNVYFSEVTGNYWFYDDSRTEWVEASRLPSWLTMTDADTRYEIEYKGTAVWKENKKHKERYKVKKDDTAKLKNE